LDSIYKNRKVMVYSRFLNESKHHHGADLNTKSKALVLKKNMTNAEKILWNHLRRGQLNGLYFRRQYPYGMYILDFYCDKFKLAIEVDGEIHLNRIAYDDERTQYLESTGITVLRFTNNEVMTGLDNVLNRILSFTNHVV